MECIEIAEVKKFMSNLLTKDTFDSFLLSEAEITTFNIFKIDGHIQKKFYSSEEYEEIGCPSMSDWRRVRPLVFEIIKGNKTPIRFKIVLKLGEKETKELLDRQELGFSLEDVGGLYLNILYENDKLNCVTGTSMNVFTMDKSLERAWDEQENRFLADYK